MAGADVTVVIVSVFSTSLELEYLDVEAVTAM